MRPKKTRPSEEEIRRRVHELLDLVQLDWLGDRYPPQLSGGQRQRIALARALAVEPKVLLLDEPFGALDAKVRKDLRRWLRRLHDELHITSVFVTHDQEEALEVADRIVVLNQGKIEQTGTPVEVYDNPATPFVFKFLGNVNVFQSRIHEGIARIGDMSIAAPGHNDAENLSALAYVRPHDVEVQREAEGASFSARIQDIHAIGRWSGWNCSIWMMIPSLSRSSCNANVSLRWVWCAAIPSTSNQKSASVPKLEDSSMQSAHIKWALCISTSLT